MIILTETIAFLLVLFLFFSLKIKAGERESEINTASSFKELTEWMEANKSTGGKITLTDDITIGDGETYTFNNGRYRKDITIDTAGFTIYVKGYLELWPYLKITGNGKKKEIFHVYPGGELWMISIQVDAGKNGTAIVQEEGSFLIYGSGDDMGLPAFVCTGRIIPAQTITAAADSWYNLRNIPLIRISEEDEFSSDLLPETIKAKVNENNQDLEKEIEVVWDSSSFPKEEERTLVTGSFPEGYTVYKNYIPRCLVIWESDTKPFFLNGYKESSKWYDSFFIYAETPNKGTVRLQGSDDGENWEELTNAEEYEFIDAEEKDSIEWYFYYSKEEGAQNIPRYFRMVQQLEDGTEVYSESIEMSEDNIFVQSDIGGGRGGELSPLEGENRVPENTEKEELSEIPYYVESGETKEDEKSHLENTWRDERKISRIEQGTTQESSTNTSETVQDTTESEGQDSYEKTEKQTVENSSEEKFLEENTEIPENTQNVDNTTQTQEKAQKDETLKKRKSDSIIGIGIVLVIVLGTVIYIVKYKKK